MELRHLRYFVAVAEELSFTAAAHRLGVSQPPLSQQIRDLEWELKTALFVRTSRRVELTAAGRAFFEHAHAILAQTEQAAEQAGGIGGGRVGPLDIGTGGSFLWGAFAPLFAAFSAQFPQAALRIYEMGPQEQEGALHAQRKDISFLRQPTDAPAMI